MTPEGRVKEKFKAYTKEIGAYVFWPVQMGYGAKTLDALVCHQGQFYGVEFKRPGVQKMTAFQQCVSREIAEAGGGVWLENSEGLETTRERLR